MLSLSQATTAILSQNIKVSTYTVPLLNAQGKALAQDIYADRDYPPFNRAAMDGIAIKYEDFQGGNRAFTIVETIFAGESTDKNLLTNECFKIMTGAAVPMGADTVIKIEDTYIEGHNIRVKDIQLKKGQNIAIQGEDCKQNDLVIPKRTLCNAVALSTLAAMGYTEVEVFDVPKIAIITTGNEIVDYTSEPNPFQIRNSNSVFITAFLRKIGIEPTGIFHAKDELTALENTIKQALPADILIVTGGVSAGEADYLPQLLEKIGVQKLFHKVEIKPGKPLWFGVMGSKVVFSLPGNPISVQVAIKIFVEPFIRKMIGLAPTASIWLPMAVSRAKKVSFTEIFPSKIVVKDQKTMVMPLLTNGSGDIVNTYHSDGIAIQKMEDAELREGSMVEFLFW